MNEELIRQCARSGIEDWLREEYPSSETMAFNAIRLYHARAVAPLEQENANLRELMERLLPCAEYLHEEDENLGELIEEVKTALAPFQQDGNAPTPRPSPDVARLVEAAQEARYFVHTTKFMNDEHDEARRAVFGKLTTALAPFPQEATDVSD